LNLEFDGAGIVGGNVEDQRIGVLADNDGRREGLVGIGALIGDGAEDGLKNVVGRPMGIAPDVDIGKLDTVSGGGAGPEFSRLIQLSN
jgi:hypothetical protein